MHDIIDLKHHATYGLSVCGMTFGDFEVEGANFADDDLSGVILRKIKFKHCSFSKTSLSSAELTECTFVECDLEETAFRGAIFDQVTFCDCAMEGATFQNADFESVFMQECRGRVNFSHVDCNAGTSFVHCKFWQSSAIDTNFDNVYFLQTDLSELSVSSETSIFKTEFESCDLTNCKFIETKRVEEAIFKNCTVSPFLRPMKRKLKQVDFPISKSKGSAYFPEASRVSNPYRNVSFCAHLECSSVEEFRAVT